MNETEGISKQAFGALSAINDICHDTNRVSVSSTKRLIEEWDGDPGMGKLFAAFLAFREAVAEFEATNV